MGPRRSPPPQSIRKRKIAVTEVHLLQNASEELSDQLAEASYVAKQIKRMLDEGFTVTESGALRPVRPKDICILLRSMKNRAEIYSDELSKQGIEVWTDAKNGFLESVEISTALSILRAVDNPLIDIHLTAAMMSPVYGFTADDMAVLRLRDRSRHLYLNCQEIAAGENLSEQEKPRQQLCQKFLDSFAQLRVIASASPAHQLIQQLIERTGLWDLVLAMKYGEVRKANLRLLIQYAQEYEAGGQKGIAGFLRFVDKMISRGEDWSCASSVTDRSDAVRIMSVHHSKGLEFPVVFLCDTSKRFNTQDLRSNMLLHSQLGFACCARDFVTRKQYPTVPMEALKLELQRSMLSEEMRILYVALTRAKEKLIITSVQNDLEKKLSGYVNALTERGTVSPYVARSASSYADWILMSLVFHPDFTRLCIDLGCMPEDVITLPACRFQPVLARDSRPAGGAGRGAAHLLRGAPTAAGGAYPRPVQRQLPRPAGAGDRHQALRLPGGPSRRGRVFRGALFQRAGLFKGRRRPLRRAARNGAAYLYELRRPCARPAGSGRGDRADDPRALPDGAGGAEP